VQSRWSSNVGATMNTKLTINLKDGILDVDGSEDFVRSIYEDFKGEVAKRLTIAPVAPKQIDATPAPSPEAIEALAEMPKKARTRRAPISSDGQKPRSAKYKPTFDPTLDVNGLVEFYDSMDPDNIAEKILTFAIFLRDHRNMQSCTADDIFTCFYTVKDRTKIPEAFEQAFRDTQSRTHFIQVNSLQDITITIPGNNKFEDMKKKRKAVA
jgi:hypothetical protein